MNLFLSVLMPIAAIIILMIAISMIGKIGQKYNFSAEVKRKCVHVMIGLFALGLPFTFPNKWSVVFLILLSLLAMIIMRIAPKILGGAGDVIHGVERKSLGDIWLGLSVGYLFLQSHGNYILYGLPLAIITLSDAAAALTGSSYGRRRFTTDDGNKSWEGVTAFVMVSIITSMIMLLLFSDAPRGNVIILSIIIAAFGAVVEAVSWRGLDNLFVPISVHFFLMGFIDANPIYLCAVALIFFGAITIAHFYSGRINLSPFAANAFVIAIFIFLGVGQIYGAVIPIMAMIAYLFTRTSLQLSGRKQDLNFLATICATGLIWLFIDKTIGNTAVHFYNMAMAGIALCYTLLALWNDERIIGNKRRIIGYLILPLMWCFIMFYGYGPAASHATAKPPQYYSWVILADIIFITLIIYFKPNVLRLWRAPRIALLSSIIPLISYFIYIRGL